MIRQAGKKVLIEKLLDEKKEALHFTLIDPDRQTPEKAKAIAKKCQQYDTDAIMIGGSSSFNQRLLDDTVRAVKESVDLPTILFPNSAATVSRYADYIFFMSLLNSKDFRYLIKEQVSAVPLIQSAQLEPISMGYLVISTSSKPTTIEKRVKLDVIDEKDVTKAVDYALAAQYLGMSCVYLEAGSGAEKPVPTEMVQAVRTVLGVPLIVGGGIREASQAVAIVRAGADVIVTGTIVEQDISRLKSLIRAVMR